MKITRWAIVAVLALGIAACSKSATTTAEAPADAAKSKRDQWLTMVASQAPSAICQDGSAYVSCFQLSLDECSKAISRLATDCVEKMREEIPVNIVDSSDVQREWGQKIGYCTGKAYADEFAGKRLDTPECANL